MLIGKGKPDDGYSQEEAKKEVAKGYVPPPANQPDDIEKGTEATGSGGSGDNLFSKGPQNHTGQFEALYSEGNAYNGTTKQKTTNDIAHGSKEAAENYPYQVAHKVHRNKYNIYPRWKRVFIPREDGYSCRS
jgi:hypothetical protein